MFYANEPLIPTTLITNKQNMFFYIPIVYYL